MGRSKKSRKGQKPRYVANEDEMKDEIDQCMLALPP